MLAIKQLCCLARADTYNVSTRRHHPGEPMIDSYLSTCADIAAV